MLKIGIDLDDTVDHCPKFFSLMTRAMRPEAEIHVVSAAARTPRSELRARKRLLDMGVCYDRLVLTADKADYLRQAGVTIHFGRDPAKFPQSVTVFRIRDPTDAA